MIKKALKKIKIILYIFLLRDTSRLNILVFGTGRSGTTWVQDLLNNDNSFRSIFEPFNRTMLYVLKKKNLEKFNFHYGRYLSPNEKDVTNIRFVEKLFSGELKDIIFDQKNYFRFQLRFTKGRIIKEITGSMYLGFIKNKYPETPLIYIFRSPYSIVLSRLIRGWGTFNWDAVIKQKSLVENHLHDKIDFIKNVDKSNSVVNDFLSIAIEYYVVLRELRDKPNTVFFCYEDIKLNPIGFLTFLNKSLEPQGLFNVSNVDYTKGGSGYMNKTSLSNMASFDKLKANVSQTHFNQLQEIFKEFNLDDLYDDQLTPKNILTQNLN